MALFIFAVIATIWNIGATVLNVYVGSWDWAVVTAACACLTGWIAYRNIANRRD